MKRYSRLISLFLCVALLISCMVTPASAAGSDEIHSYIYLDFVNPGGHFVASKDFVVHGTTEVTSNTIYLLCSENTNSSLTGYVSSSAYNIYIERIWKTGNICCYRVVSNTAQAFTRDFTLQATTSDGLAGGFFVYKVFTVGAAGITKLDASGLIGRWGQVLHPNQPEESFSIPSLPYVFHIPDVYSPDSEWFFDVDIPISKLIGFDQCSFTVYGEPDNGYYLDDFTVLYNGSPIPFELTNNLFGNPINTTHYIFSEGGYITALFDVPEQIGNNSYITLRFVWHSANLEDYIFFSIKFQDLFGRFSFVKSDRELLLDIAESLKDLDFDDSELVAAIQQLQTQLHNDLAGIQSGITQSNTLLDSIRNNLVNFRTNVGNWFTQLGTNISNGFANVGFWFLDLGNNFSSAIAEWGQNIVDAIISTNDQAADDFVDKSDEQTGEIADSMDKIDQMETPDIQDIINPTVPPTLPTQPPDPNDPEAPTEDPSSRPVDVLDVDTVDAFGDILGIFFSNGIFSSIFSFVLLMMLASFVLFGKR